MMLRKSIFLVGHPSTLNFDQSVIFEFGLSSKWRCILITGPFKGYVNPQTMVQWSSASILAQLRGFLEMIPGIIYSCPAMAAMALEEVIVIAHPRVERLPLWGPWGRDPRFALRHQRLIQKTIHEPDGRSEYNSQMIPLAALQILRWPDDSAKDLKKMNCQYMCSFMFLRFEAPTTSTDPHVSPPIRFI